MPGIATRPSAGIPSTGPNYCDVFDFPREPYEWLKRIDEGDRPGSEHSLPFLIEALVRFSFWNCLIIAEGVPLLEWGITVWEAGGGHVNNTYSKSPTGRGDNPYR